MQGASRALRGFTQETFISAHHRETTCQSWVSTQLAADATTDVTRLVDSLERPEEAGKVIPVGGPDVLTYRQIAVLAAGAAGVDRPRSAVRITST